jgi:class 3 adenylate cyclase/tetratricopeptide (TPR) repeat protein
VVTALFSDVVESTQLGEALDPEVVRSVLTRYFDEAKAVVERHGGTTEKFIGDAVVALFGVPTTREDDALRALRAADEIRARLRELNDEFEARHGVRIEVRTGVNTGEVVVGETDLEGFRASGDTLNTAARLEQAAGPGEILVGALTRELGGNAIEVDPLPPLELKGKSGTVEAFRLVRVLPDASPYVRRQDAPLVGREDELAALRAALEDSTAQRHCQLITVVGAAGVGKSRLTREFVESLGEATHVLVGRCVAYGEGGTFLPVAEALRPLLGEDTKAGVLVLLEEDESREVVAEHVAAAFGADGSPTSTEDAFWALRRLLETVATDRRVVLVVDDVHWAEPTLLDLLEYVSSFSAAPIVIIALTRPDLLEERPIWATPREHATIVRLDPLAERDAVRLAGLLTQTALGEDELRRVVEAADGNPLFLEQLLALNSERGQELVVPPTIQALLAARIDRLDADERLVLAAASVEGREFHRDAVVELLPEPVRPELRKHLLALGRRQFVRAVSGDGSRDAYAFSHALMRDAAYGAIPKGERAELHVRLARYLESRQDTPGELVGFHLADAVRLRRELAPDTNETRDLAARAAQHLAESANRALAMGDDPAAARLLERAVELVPASVPDGRDVRFQLGRALAGTGKLDRAEAAFSEALAAGRDSSDRALELRSVLALANLRSQTDVTISMAEIRERAEATIPELELLGDERGLALAWWLVHWTQFRQGQYRRSIEAAERVVAHAVRANERREELRALGAIAIAARSGDHPVPEALEMCDDVVARADGARLVDAFAARARGHLLAKLGEFERGRVECTRAQEILEELGLPISALGVTAERALVEQLAGNLAGAEQWLRAASQRFRELGDIAYLSWINPLLAQVLAERGAAADALALSRSAREEMQPDHAFGQIVSRTAEGAALRSLGRGAEAREVALEAHRRAEATDGVDLQAQALLLLADLDDDEGENARAAQRRARALELYDAKGEVVLAARVRELV